MINLGKYIDNTSSNGPASINEQNSLFLTDCLGFSEADDFLLSLSSSTKLHTNR